MPPGSSVLTLLAVPAQDCNLVEYDATLATTGPSVAGAVYSSRSNGRSSVAYHDPGCQLLVQNSVVSIVDGRGTTISSTSGFSNPVTDTLYPGTPLYQGQRLYSQNGLYFLTVQVPNCRTPGGVGHLPDQALACLGRASACALMRPLLP